MSEPEELPDIDRLETQELASSMASTSIDGTWRRDCVLQEASDRGAKLLVRGSIEGLNLN